MKYLVGNIEEVTKANNLIWDLHPNGMTARHDQFIGTLDNDGVEITEQYIQALFQAPKTFPECTLEEKIQYYSNVPNFKLGQLQLDPRKSAPSARWAALSKTTFNKWAIKFHNCIINEQDEDGNIISLHGGYDVEIVDDPIRCPNNADTDKILVFKSEAKAQEAGDVVGYDPMKMKLDGSFLTSFTQLFSGKNWFSDGIRNYALWKPDDTTPLEGLDYVESNYKPTLFTEN